MFLQSHSRIACFTAIVWTLAGGVTLGDDHWAWSPLDAQPAPAVNDASQIRTPVDAFIYAKLEEKSVPPAAPADPLVLLRRVYLDLIGLPPTPEEQRAFSSDPSDRAFEHIVDDLLARPQYGERWGRHWLDVARYAETKGYERDEFKKFTWRYRDYVIDAFNRDLPYDQFVTEQLAGDEIPDADARTQIATTFLSLGTFDTIAADKEVAIYDTLDDMVATTSMAFLGQTVQCARCHDHKFEPVTQVDYYRLLAAFESLDVTKKERQIGTEEDFEKHRAAEEHFEAAVLKPEMEAEEKVWLPMLERLQRDGVPKGKKPRLDEKNMKLAIESITMTQEERTKDHLRVLEKERGKIRGALHDIAGEAEKEALKACEKRLKEVEAKRPQAMMAWVYPERGAKPKATQLRVRGDVHQKGEEVTFGVPVVLARDPLPEPSATGRSSGRRRVLAEWITGAGAPLAARVMANRVWQFHFGRGFVQDANNFGVSGGEPSHPELLDWLAGELIDGGWKLKPLHRTIVLSNTYRMSAAHPRPDADPENRLFSRWPLHRLQAEGIRDSILAVSGKLNLKMAGPSIYPPMDRQVVGASSKSDWGKSTEDEASRRSIYVFAKRAVRLPELAVLGSPESSESCGQRNVSTTAIQSLLMFNGSFMAEQAEHLAARLEKEAGAKPSAQIERLFQLALCRSPRAAETGDALEFLEGAAEEKKMRPLAALCLVLLNTNEFVYQN
ncbi:MAG: hypothetical protein ACI8XO_004801 [Verrucomicrobiales bacterium]